MSLNKIISIEELWQFYNLSPNLICIEGNSSYFAHTNPSFAQLLEFTEEELLDIPYLDLIHPEDRKVTRKKMNELKSGAPVVNFKNRCQAKSGSYKWLSWTASLSISDGNIYAVGSDCTENAMLEERLLKEIQIKDATIQAKEKEWAKAVTELHENINSLLKTSLQYSDTSERNYADGNSFLPHSSTSAFTVIHEIKKLTANLNIYLHKESSLTENLQKLIADTMAIHPLRIKLYAESFSEESFSNELKFDVYEIIRAQLSDITNHSWATSVQINIEQISNKLFIAVEDNRTRLNNETQKNGSGLSNIIALAKQYKGEVFTDIVPGKGYTLSVTL